VSRVLWNAWIYPTKVTDNISSHWAQYNQGLTKITDEGKCDGVMIAKGSGHFVQRDNAGFVAGEIQKVLEKLGW
jgi:hypothetical protein